MENSENVIPFSKPVAVPMIEAPEPVKKPREHYRVGFDDQGYTTLTLMSEYGGSMTLSMNQSSCEQMIKMLRSTYSATDDDDPTDDPDGGESLPVRKAA